MIAFVERKSFRCFVGYRVAKFRLPLKVLGDEYCQEEGHVEIRRLNGFVSDGVIDV